MDTGRAIPPGWRANPSAWPQRLPIVGVALAGFAIATWARPATS